MKERDRVEILQMMETFYTSPAVFTNGSMEIYEADFAACISTSPYLSGYVFEENDEILGYAMIAKSFSTEFGKPCIWIEDLYMKPQHRGKGIGSAFFQFIETQFSNCIVRLEAEEENHRAVALYQSCGYEILPYLELKKVLGE
jgi:GNAT superfamily N-acetyltransferase